MTRPTLGSTILTPLSPVIANRKECYQRIEFCPFDYDSLMGVYLAIYYLGEAPADRNLFLIMNSNMQYQHD